MDKKVIFAGLSNTYIDRYFTTAKKALDYINSVTDGITRITYDKADRHFYCSNDSYESYFIDILPID